MLVNAIEMDEEGIYFTGLDDAIIGSDQHGQPVYSFELMIREFVKQGMTREDAFEWIEYNVLPINAGNGFVVLFENELL